MDFDPAGRWQQQPEGGTAGTPEAITPPSPDAQHAKLRAWMQSPNIATELSEELLGTVGMTVKREWEIDERMRAEWLDNIEKAQKLAIQKSEPKSYPWPRACLSLDTDVLTKTGWKSVGDVEVGDFVYSRSPQGGADYYPVTRTFRYMAEEMVHFFGKSVDLLTTTNHNMVVDYDAPNCAQRYAFIEAGEFLTKPLQWHYLPLTSQWQGGQRPTTVHGIDAIAYARFMGWYVSEGSISQQRLKSGLGWTWGSISIAQSSTANPEKYVQICRDLDACGFSYRCYENAIIVRSQSVPYPMVEELRALGKAKQKHIPVHCLTWTSDLLVELFDRMIAGDGCTRVRNGKLTHRVYFTISSKLAGQVQEICQKLGLRGTIKVWPAKIGGCIQGRQIVGCNEGYNVEINVKPRIRVFTLNRELVTAPCEVACVEVAPHHTVYVRRNGKALWVGNSNVVYPLMTTAAMQFAARAYPAIIHDKAVVKGEVLGRDDGVPAMGPDGAPITQPGPDGAPQPVWQTPPGALQSRADRIGAHMSWQLLSEMPEWEPETDRLLHQLPIVGTVFRKSYFDPSKGRNMSLMVPAVKLVLPYFAKSLELSPRATELVEFYPYQIREMERAGLFIARRYTVSASDGTSDAMDDDAPIVFLEQHRWWDLDGDNYPEPYVVTVDKEGSQVVRIVARYDEAGVHVDQSGRIGRIEPLQMYTQYDFLPSLDGGIYGTGFGQLLGPINAATNTTLNMLLDAGHLANTNGGFIAKNLSMNTGTLRWTMGEFKPVNAGGAPLKDSIVPLPFSGPSQVLFALLGTLIDAGKDVASVKDVLAGEQPQANVPATTVLALIEQGQKVFTAIYKRVHRGLKAELQKLYRLNKIYLPEMKEFSVGTQWFVVTRQDYSDGAGVAPVSDPEMVSDMQQLGRAQYLMQFMGNPLIIQPELMARLLKAARIDNPQKLLNTQPAPPPPQVLIKGAELDLKEREIASREMLQRAQSLQAIGQAVYALAQADAAVGDQHIQWLNSQLQAWEGAAEALHRSAEMSQGTPGTDTKPAVPGVTPPQLPPHPVHGPVAGGDMPPSGAGALGEPPVSGAKQAKDGNWYVSDPRAHRSGKWMRVEAQK